MRRVIFLLFPGFELLDHAGPLQVFHEARALGLPLGIVQCGSVPALVSEQGVELTGLSPLPPTGPDDWLVVPGHTPGRLEPPASVVDGLRRAAAAGCRIVTVCTGTFTAGRAGLLDGRECTTHWKRCDELRRTFPRARVRDDCIFAEDGPLVSSGGVTCGIDLALFLMEGWAGPAFALKVARELNVYIRCDGGHRQTSVYLDYRNHQHKGVHEVQDWLAEHPEDRRGLSGLAELCGLSVRHFTREFREATGLSPRRVPLPRPPGAGEGAAQRPGAERGGGGRRLRIRRLPPAAPPLARALRPRPPRQNLPPGDRGIAWSRPMAGGGKPAVGGAFRGGGAGLGRRRRGPGRRPGVRVCLAPPACI